VNVRETDESDTQKAIEFRAFYLANKLPLHRFTRAMCNNACHAEDVTQEVMINIYRYWGKYPNPETLIFTMARQELSRWRRRFPPTQAVPLDDRIDEIEYLMPRRHSADPLKVIEERDNVRFLLRHLPTRQREVVALCDVVGLDIKRASEVLGIGESAVKTHHKRGLDRLRALQAKRSLKPNGAMPGMKGVAE